MRDHPPELDMTIEGEFVSPARRRKPPFGTKVLAWAVVVAVVAFSLVVAVFALWLLAFLIPVAVVAGLVAYLAFRFQIWRAGGSVSSRTIHIVRRR